MLSSCIVLGFLAVLAWIDMKEKELPLLLIVILGGAGIPLFFWTTPFSWKSLVGGVIIGALVLLCALLTQESIGAGDGILLCATGVYLGVWQNLILFFFATVLSAAAALFLLIRKQCDRKQRIPFVPFLLAADVIMLWGTGVSSGV